LLIKKIFIGFYFFYHLCKFGVLNFKQEEINAKEKLTRHLYLL